MCPVVRRNLFTSFGSKVWERRSGKVRQKKQKSYIFPLEKVSSFVVVFHYSIVSLSLIRFLFFRFCKVIIGVRAQDYWNICAESARYDLVVNGEQGQS